MSGALHCHLLRIVAAGGIAWVLAGCYAHAGQPYQGDADTWRQLADAACERGDQLACETLLERAGVDEQPERCRNRHRSQSSICEAGN